jgi:hypothetical protein
LNTHSQTAQMKSWWGFFKNSSGSYPFIAAVHSSQTRQNLNSNGWSAKGGQQRDSTIACCSTSLTFENHAFFMLFS